MFIQQKDKGLFFSTNDINPAVKTMYQNILFYICKYFR